MCRWISEVPSQMRSMRASRQIRSSGSSSIRPMPPWIWIASSATIAEHLGGLQLGHRDVGVGRRALVVLPGRPSVSSSAARSSSAMSASLKPTPWKRPIFWPNCSRSAAWRTARSSARSARPRQVAATCSRVLPSQVPARSKPLPSSPSSASLGHPAGRSRGSRWCSRGARRCGSRRAPRTPGCRGRPGTSTIALAVASSRLVGRARTGSRSRPRRRG